MFYSLLDVVLIMPMPKGYWIFCFLPLLLNTFEHGTILMNTESNILILSACAHITLATIRLSMLCVTECVLHFDACVQVEDGKIVRHEDL